MKSFKNLLKLKYTLIILISYLLIQKKIILYDVKNKIKIMFTILFIIQI